MSTKFRAGKDQAQYQRTLKRLLANVVMVEIVL